MNTTSLSERSAPTNNPLKKCPRCGQEVKVSYFESHYERCSGLKRFTFLVKWLMVIIVVGCVLYFWYSENTNSRQANVPANQNAVKPTPQQSTQANKNGNPVEKKSPQSSLPESSSREETPPVSEEAPPERVKVITELTPEELNIANSICQKALKEHFANSVNAWVKTTYHYLPTSDDEIGDTRGKKLRVPISLVSVSVTTVYDFPNMKRRLKEEVARLEASYGGRKYRIYKTLVHLSSGGGVGGSIGMSSDMVTIIPYSVLIY